MTTVAWFLILMGALVLRQVVKGRVMETTQDLSDAFLAIVSGDTKGLNAVLARTGDFNKFDQAEIAEGMGDAGPGGDTDTGKYKLSSKTKPHVVAAINTLGPMFGIKTVYGWSATGSVATSDHPKGLAGDFMTSSKEVGDKLAAYAVANAAKFGITYVIWYKRIWTPSQGWHEYTGPRDHTDHVHISFKDK
jgi:hypothetical protein